MDYATTRTRRIVKVGLLCMALAIVIALVITATSAHGQTIIDPFIECAQGATCYHIFAPVVTK